MTKFHLQRSPIASVSKHHLQVVVVQHDFLSRNDPKSTCMVFHQRRQTPQPVTIIAVGDTVDFANFRLVDMTANHAIDTALCHSCD